MLYLHLFYAVFLLMAYMQFREGLEYYMRRLGLEKPYIDAHKGLFFATVHRQNGLGFRYLLNIGLLVLTAVYPVLAVVLCTSSTLYPALTAFCVVFGAVFSVSNLLSFRDENIVRYQTPWALSERVRYKVRQRRTRRVLRTKERYRLWDLIDTFLPLLLALLGVFLALMNGNI